MHECVFTKALHNLEKLEPRIGGSIFLPAHKHTRTHGHTELPRQWKVKNTQWVGCRCRYEQRTMTSDGKKRQPRPQGCLRGREVSRTTDLLARQLVNTMYEVTVSSVDTVGLLRVIAAPRMAHAWRWGGGGGGHYGRTVETNCELCNSQKKCTLRHVPATPPYWTEKCQPFFSFFFFPYILCRRQSRFCACCSSPAHSCCCFCEWKEWCSVWHISS